MSPSRRCATARPTQTQAALHATTRPTAHAKTRLHKAMGQGLAATALGCGTLLLGTLLLNQQAHASSHREAPSITTSPKVDGTDFYMFRSYETGRSDYITLIANYQPFQGPAGGPNYFALDPNALYEIHIDNTGDAKEDISFQFRFNNSLKNSTGATLNIGNNEIAVPLVQLGRTIANVGDSRLNMLESYTLNVVRGGRRSGNSQAVLKTSGARTLEKPLDYIGEKTLGNAAAYETYAQKHIHTVNIPGCTGAAAQARVFVGQRQEAFSVSLGPVFDLVNYSSTVLTTRNATTKMALNNTAAIQNFNITSIALEVHKDCLATAGDPVVGGWTTASLRQTRIMNGAPPEGLQTNEKNGGAWTQVSRLGQPLVNEVVIGLKDKDRFNASKPSQDGQFLNYVLYPTLPALIDISLNGQRTTAIEPTNFPRTDLATVFLTGIPGVNKPVTVTPAEMLRLNTSIAPKALASQNEMGVLGGDTAGFPNGRRPKDDVTDIALQAVLGALCMANGSNNSLQLNTVPGTSLSSACNPTRVPLGATSLQINDGVNKGEATLIGTFPYLGTPVVDSKL